MSSYDYVIAGGGAAGLSLAYHLVQSDLNAASILIVEKDAKDRNDRTWCSWVRSPTVFDEIVYHRWSRLAFVSDDFRRSFDLGDYCYQMIRGIDFYRFTRERLSNAPNVTFARGVVERVRDGAGCGEVWVDGVVHKGRWVFDSILQPQDLQRDPLRYHYIQQHFLGWEIESEVDCFDPEEATLFDFRTPQKGGMRFCYVLPFSPRHALVEYTLFTADLLQKEEYVAGLKTYIEEVLGITTYTVLSEESGVIPMTDQPLARRNGLRILHIGTKGGRVKPSTGYAFTRILQDSQAIVDSLVSRRHPFALPAGPWRYRWFDSALLQILYRHGELSKPIFTALFRNNPIDRIFRFLDETGSWRENLLLTTSLQPWPFIRAVVKLALLRRV